MGAQLPALKSWYQELFPAHRDWPLGLCHQLQSPVHLPLWCKPQLLPQDRKFQAPPCWTHFKIKLKCPPGHRAPHCLALPQHCLLPVAPSFTPFLPPCVTTHPFKELCQKILWLTSFSKSPALNRSLHFSTAWMHHPPYLAAKMNFKYPYVMPLLMWILLFGDLQFISWRTLQIPCSHTNTSKSGTKPFTPTDHSESSHLLTCACL